METDIHDDGEGIAEVAFSVTPVSTTPQQTVCVPSASRNPMSAPVKLYNTFSAFSDNEDDTDDEFEELWCDLNHSQAAGKRVITAGEHDQVEQGRDADDVVLALQCDSATEPSDSSANASLPQARHLSTEYPSVCPPSPLACCDIAAKGNTTISVDLTVDNVDKEGVEGFIDHQFKPGGIFDYAPQPPGFSFSAAPSPVAEPQTGAAICKTGDNFIRGCGAAYNVEMFPFGPLADSSMHLGPLSHVCRQGVALQVLLSYVHLQGAVYACLTASSSTISTSVLMTNDAHRPIS